MPGLRILAVRLSSMGDIIHALPAVASLKHSFPKSHISWVVRPRWMPLLEGNPFIDELIPLERTPRSLSRSWRAMRAEKFDMAIDFQGLVQSALISAAAGADRVIGFHRSTVRERPAALFYSTGVATQSLHAVDRNLDLVAGAGASNLLRIFPIPDGDPEDSLPEGKFALTSPFAGWGSKQWPLERYAELAAELDMPLVVNGPPEAAGLLRQIRGAVVHVSGIRGLIHATRKAHAVIGIDSGPMHLAAALGKPGVAIFGPTDPARNGPYGGSLRTVRSPGAVTSYKRRSDPESSMIAISAGEVLRALHAILELRSSSCPA